jgi:hypothetical protein
MSEKNGGDGLRPNVPNFGLRGPNISEVAENSIESVARLLEEFEFSSSIGECMAFATVLGAQGRPPVAACLNTLAEFRAGRVKAFSHLDAHELLSTLRPVKERFASSKPFHKFDEYLTKMIDELFAHVEKLNPQEPQE